MDCIVLYQGSRTWQRLVVISRSPTSLPAVGSDSLVRALCVGEDSVFMYCGVAFVQSARYPVWLRSEVVRLCGISETNIVIIKLHSELHCRNKNIKLSRHESLNNSKS